MAITQETLINQEFFKAAIDPKLSLDSRYEALRMMRTRKSKLCIVAAKAKKEKVIRDYNEVLGWTKDEVVKKYRVVVKQKAYTCWLRSRQVGFDVEDLIQEGFIGLLKAFDSYTHKKIDFDIYAGKYMYHRMLHFLKRQVPLVRPPTDRQKFLISKVVYMDGSFKTGARKFDWYESLAGFTMDDHSHLYLINFIQSLTRHEQNVARLLLQDFSQREIGLMIGSSKQAVNESVKSIRSKYIHYETTKRYMPGRGWNLCQR